MNPNLDTIKAVAYAYARLYRDREKQVPASLLLYDNAGHVRFSQLAGDKDDWAQTHQFFALCPGMLASLLMVEAWQRSVEPGEDFDPQAVHDHPDREEVLVLNLLTPEGQWLLTAPVNRDLIGPGEWQRVDAPAENSTSWAGRFIRESADS